MASHSPRPPVTGFSHRHKVHGAGALPLTLLMRFLDAHEFFMLMKPSSCIVSFVACAFGVAILNALIILSLSLCFVYKPHRTAEHTCEQKDVCNECLQISGLRQSQVFKCPLIAEFR